MTWVRLEDSFPDHSKIDPLSDGAFRLHVAGICHSARNLTDGFVQTSRPPRLIPKFRPSYLSELVSAGLWIPDDNGWRIKGFLDFNPSAEKVKADRKAAADRMAFRRSSREVRANKGRSSLGGSATPTRPDPSTPQTPQGGRRDESDVWHPELCGCESCCPVDELEAKRREAKAQ